MKRVLAWFLAGAVSVGVLFAGGLALAAGGGAGADTISACYRNSTGALRIDTGAGCGTNETPISLGAGLSTRIVVAEASLPNPGFQGTAAECEPGEVVLGGGLEIESINPDQGITTSAPVTLADGRQAWQVTMHSDATGDPVLFRAYAVCAPGTPG